MKPIYRQALKEVSEQVFEELAFMFADSDPGDLEAWEREKSYLKAEIAFQGPVSGSLWIAAPPAFCRELAANILGLDGDELSAREKAEDALKELVNIVCGHFLTRTAGEDPLFTISPPEAREVARPDAGNEEPLRLLVEDYPVALNVTLNNGRGAR